LCPASLKQVVSGTNQHVVFEATAPDGTPYIHTATVFIALDGSMKTQRHERTQASGLLPTGVIVGCACAAVVGMLALAHKRKSPPATSSIEMASGGQPNKYHPPSIVAVDTASAL
jgi:hypothetical protein